MWKLTIFLNASNSIVLRSSNEKELREIKAYVEMRPSRETDQASFDFQNSEIRIMRRALVATMLERLDDE